MFGVVTVIFFLFNILPGDPAQMMLGQNQNSAQLDVVKKKYIFVGFAAWVLLIPLTITSSQKMMLLLKQNWKKLHKLIYVIAILGSLHFIWLSKTIYFKPLIYFVLITVLLALRVNFKRIFEK